MRPFDMDSQENSDIGKTYFKWVQVYLKIDEIIRILKICVHGTKGRVLQYYAAILLVNQK